MLIRYVVYHYGLEEESSLVKWGKRGKRGWGSQKKRNSW